MILRITYSFLLIFLIGFYYFVPETMNKSIMIGLLLTVLASIIMFIFKKEPFSYLKKQYLKHSTLALIGILIVFFQFPLDYVLGNISANNLDLWANKSIVLKSFTLSVIGLVCFLLGYLVFRYKTSKRPSRPERPINVHILNLLAGITLIIYFLTINPLYLAGYYGVVDMGPDATYAITLFEVLIFASVIQKCRNMVLSNALPNTFMKYIKQIGWPLITLIGIYLVSVLISGDRGPLISYCLLLFSGYFFVTKKKLSLKYIILLLFIGASVITLLGIVRGLNKELSFSQKIQESLNDKYSGAENSFLPQTATLAGSVKALNTAVNYVPSQHDFFWGRFQFQKLTSAIPFFSVFYPIIFKETPDKYSTSAAFVTWIRQGDNPTSGDGSSSMADLYFDFGLIGIIIGMFFFGYMMRFAEVNMYASKFPSLFIQIFFMVYLCYDIYIARDTIFTCIKSIIWIYVVLSVNRFCLQRFRIKL